MAASAEHVTGLAGRYASALYDLARERNAVDPVADDLAALKRLMGESEDFRALVRSPVLGRDEQRRAINAVTERAGAHDLTKSFMGLLAAKRRLFVLGDAADVFEALRARDRGEARAEVISAVPLTEEQVEALRQKLQAGSSRSIDLSTRVDPSLLGGVIVRQGSRLIDASLKSKLARLEQAMKGRAA